MYVASTLYSDLELIQFEVSAAYYLNRHPPTAQGSIFNLLTSKVLPLLVDRPDRPYPHLTILNTGAIRFDILKGDFTRNDQVRPIF